MNKEAWRSPGRRFSLQDTSPQPLKTLPAQVPGLPGGGHPGRDGGRREGARDGGRVVRGQGAHRHAQPGHAAGRRPGAGRVLLAAGVPAGPDLAAPACTDSPSSTYSRLEAGTGHRDRRPRGRDRDDHRDPGRSDSCNRPHTRCRPSVRLPKRARRRRLRQAERGRHRQHPHPPEVRTDLHRQRTDRWRRDRYQREKTCSSPPPATAAGPSRSARPGRPDATLDCTTRSTIGPINLTSGLRSNQQTAEFTVTITAGHPRYIAKAMAFAKPTQPQLTLPFGTRRLKRLLTRHGTRAQSKKSDCLSPAR